MLFFLGAGLVYVSFLFVFSFIVHCYLSTECHFPHEQWARASKQLPKSFLLRAALQEPTAEEPALKELSGLLFAFVILAPALKIGQSTGFKFWLCSQSLLVIRDVKVKQVAFCYVEQKKYCDVFFQGLEAGSFESQKKWLHSQILGFQLQALGSAPSCSSLAPALLPALALAFAFAF